jgi:hypothetical protein
MNISGFSHKKRIDAVVRTLKARRHASTESSVITIEADRVLSCNKTFGSSEAWNQKIVGGRSLRSRA